MWTPASGSAKLPLLPQFCLVENRTSPSLLLVGKARITVLVSVSLSSLGTHVGAWPAWVGPGQHVANVAFHSIVF